MIHRSQLIKSELEYLQLCFRSMELQWYKSPRVGGMVLFIE